MKTRDRIIEQARLLYNQLGYANVSSATLADHLGIAEGNLWYHFRTKRAILSAISERFAEDIEQRLFRLPNAQVNIVDDYAALLQMMMAELREYRFLYRDQADYGGHDEIVRLGVPSWTRRSQAQVRAFLKALVGAKLLDWPEERLGDLAINATIILRYGLDHFREMGAPIEQGGGAVRNTLLRHLTLFEHRLMPDAAVRLRRALESGQSSEPAEGQSDALAAA